jgi:hypothetical protein
MSEHLTHPDPDSLNAFIEGVLPEHERAACLAHLAVCAECREVVFLAQEPVSASPVIEKTAWWRGWWTPLPILGAAALAGALVLSSVFLQKEKPVAPTPQLVARDEPATVMPPQQREMAAAPAAKAKRIMAAPPLPVAPAPLAPPSEAPAKKADVSPSAGAESVQVQASAGQVMTETSAAPPPPAPLPTARVSASPISASPMFAAVRTGIAGTVTDASGAVVSNASIQARPLPGGDVRDARSNPSGQFEIAGLKPGSYELKISAPGFRQASRQVDVPANQIAQVDSKLSVGAATETVEVSASVGSLARNLPIANSVTAGKHTLATDTSGALLLSQNGGRKWKKVKPVWHGKVVALTTLPDLTFQLTTDTAEVWLSRDGSRWQMKR